MIINPETRQLLLSVFSDMDHVRTFVDEYNTSPLVMAAIIAVCDSTDLINEGKVNSDLSSLMLSVSVLVTVEKETFSFDSIIKNASAIDPNTDLNDLDLLGEKLLDLAEGF